MTNYERIKNLTIEEMANEIKAIVNWDRKEKNKAEQDDQFYINYLNEKSPDVKCSLMDSDYCKNECPLCRLGDEDLEPETIDVDGLNSKYAKKDLKDYNRRYRSK